VSDSVGHLLFPSLETGLSTLDGGRVPADSAAMRHIPISLKLVAVLSLLAEATAAALVFWHTGPRAR
jgi:hypothetical protein